MKRNESLAIEYSNTLFEDPWHGPSVRSILIGVTEEKSKIKIMENAHSIYEILLHMLAWTEEVNSRLRGGIPKEPVNGDWPKLSDFQKLDWDGLIVKFLDESLSTFVTIKNFPAVKLNKIVGVERNAPLGTGISYKSMITGLIQHNIYHSAQISLLNKII